MSYRTRTGHAEAAATAELRAPASGRHLILHPIFHHLDGRDLGGQLPHGVLVRCGDHGIRRAAVIQDPGVGAPRLARGGGKIGLAVEGRPPYVRPAASGGPAAASPSVAATASRASAGKERAPVRFMISAR